jgi:phosphoketolase
MMLVNGVSRYHVAIEAVERSAKLGDNRHQLLGELQKRMEETRKYILENGEDVEGTYDTPRLE